MRNDIASELMQVTMQQNSKLDPAEQRKQEMDKIYDNFAAYAEKDSCVTLEEFRKYEILYSSELRKKYANHSLTPEEEEDIKLYNNHSCDPNCGMRGEITFVALRNIKVDEELTIDYAFIDNEDYSFVCHCGSSNCRKKVTGFDWKNEDLQKKYYPYFAEYLKEKIRKNAN